RRVHRALRAEREAVGRDERAPLRAREELIVAADLELGSASRQVADAGQTELARAVGAHRERIAVFETERAGHRDPMLAGKELLDLGEQRTAALPGVAAVHDRRPDRARVVDVRI